MRSFYTLLLLFAVAVALGQLPQPRFIEHPKFVNHLHFDRPDNTTRSLSTCDSNDLLDYSSCTEVITMLEGGSATSLYGFNSNIHPIYIQPMSTFITAASASTGDATFMGMAFDTLVFQDYPGNKLYNYPLASSTITLNGLLFFYAFDADTVASDGLIADDSLVFKFYAINNSLGLGIIDTTLAGEVVMAGDSLASLYTGPTSIGIRTIPASVSFNKGQGFFIRVQYLNKDTSTHFSMATSFVDSCGPITLTYNGTHYYNQIVADISPLTSFVEDPGDPDLYGDPTYGLTFFGSIVGPATVYNEDNEYGYFGSAFTPNPPLDCSYITNQHLCILPIINICTGFTAQIQANPPGGCPGSTINLSTFVTGSTPTITVIPNTLAIGGSPIENVLHMGTGDSTLTYAWSASAGNLSSTTSATPVLTMPPSGNVTVNVTVNDGVNDTTASIVIVSNPPIILSILNTPQPVPLNCGSGVTLQLNVTGATSGDTFTWTGPGIDTTGSGVTSLAVSLPGEYDVMAVNNSGCSAADSVAVVYANGVSNVVTFTPPPPLCTGEPGRFSNTSSSIAGWTAAWTFGDGHISDSLYSTTYSYTSPGSFATQLAMDSGGCTELSPVVNVTVNPAPSATISASGPITFCADSSVTLSAPAGLQYYQWSNGDTAHALVISAPGNYAVTVTNQYGCTAASGNDVVIVNPLPTVTLNGLPDSVCNIGTDSLTSGSPAGGTYSGLWVSDGLFHAGFASAGSYTITYSYIDANSCTNSATGNITVQICTGIDETTLDNIRIFPNPTGDVINVYNTGPETLMADLTDLSGKALIKGLFISGSAQTINLTAYSAGVYLLSLHDKSGNMKVVKVVKE